MVPLHSEHGETSRKRDRSPTLNASAGPSRLVAPAHQLFEAGCSKRARRSSRLQKSAILEDEILPMADMNPAHRVASPPHATAKSKGKSRAGKSRHTGGRGKDWADSDGETCCAFRRGLCLVVGTDAAGLGAEPEIKSNVGSRRSSRKSKKPALNNYISNSDEELALGDSGASSSHAAAKSSRKSTAVPPSDPDNEDTGGDMDIEQDQQAERKQETADTAAANAGTTDEAAGTEPFPGLGDDLPPSLCAAARGLMGGLFGGFGFGDIGTGLESTDGVSAFGATPRQAADILKKSLPAMRDANVGIRKNALSQVAELLISQPEDILGAYFSVDAYTAEFIAILSGKPNTAKSPKPGVSRAEGAASILEDEDDDMEDVIDDTPLDASACDEDAEMARILAMSAADAGLPIDGGPPYGGSASADEVESQMFAARCLANMIESMPGSSQTVVAKGGVAVLCAKLMEIEYMDLAGQVLCVCRILRQQRESIMAYLSLRQTLEKLAKEAPSQIVRENGLQAMLNYLDFHDMNDQQTALQAAAACCRSLSPDNFAKVAEVMPIVRGVLGWTTQKQVDPAANIVIRVIDSYRTRSDLLEQLLDLDTVKAVNHIFLPGNASSLLKPATFINLLRSVTVAARASPGVAHTLFEAEVASSMYCIMTGLLPPTLSEDDNVTSHLPEGVVSQNLAQSPREQIEEALTLVCELLPPLLKGQCNCMTVYPPLTHCCPQTWSLIRASTQTKFFSDTSKQLPKLTGLASLDLRGHAISKRLLHWANRSLLQQSKQKLRLPHKRHSLGSA